MSYEEREELTFDELEMWLRFLVGHKVGAQVWVGDALTSEGSGVADFVSRTNHEGLEDPAGQTLTFGAVGAWNVSADARWINEVAVYRPAFYENAHLWVRGRVGPP